MAFLDEEKLPATWKSVPKAALYPRRSWPTRHATRDRIAPRPLLGPPADPQSPPPIPPSASTARCPPRVTVFPRGLLLLRPFRSTAPRPPAADTPPSRPWDHAHQPAPLPSLPAAPPPPTALSCLTVVPFCHSDRPPRADGHGDRPRPVSAGPGAPTNAHGQHPSPSCPPSSAPHPTGPATMRRASPSVPSSWAHAPTPVPHLRAHAPIIPTSLPPARALSARLPFLLNACLPNICQVPRCSFRPSPLFVGPPVCPFLPPPTCRLC